MALEEAIRDVAEKLAAEADVRAVFGEPLKLGTRVVIPVGVVHLKVSGGLGGLSKGLGGSVDLSARPAGFLCEEDGKVVFKAIELGCGGGCRCHDKEESLPRKVLHRLRRR